MNGDVIIATMRDGKPLEDFHREQYGFTIGGPIKQDRAFYFCALPAVMSAGV